MQCQCVRAMSVCAHNVSGHVLVVRHIHHPYAKKCACNMHVTTNYMHVMVNMHVTLLLHECYMHVVRVLEMVAHVPCMLYEC